MTTGGSATVHVDATPEAVYDLVPVGTEARCTVVLEELGNLVGLVVG